MPLRKQVAEPNTYKNASADYLQKTCWNLRLHREQKVFEVVLAFPWACWLNKWYFLPSSNCPHDSLTAHFTVNNMATTMTCSLCWSYHSTHLSSWLIFTNLTVMQQWGNELSVTFSTEGFVQTLLCQKQPDTKWVNTLFVTRCKSNLNNFVSFEMPRLLAVITLSCSNHSIVLKRFPSSLYDTLVEIWFYSSGAVRIGLVLENNDIKSNYTSLTFDCRWFKTQKQDV